MTPPTNTPDKLSERLRSLSADDPNSILREAAAALNSLQAQLDSIAKELLCSGGGPIVTGLDGSPVELPVNIAHQARKLVAERARLRAQLAEAQKRLNVTDTELKSLYRELKLTESQLAAKDAEIEKQYQQLYECEVCNKNAKAEVERLRPKEKLLRMVWMHMRGNNLDGTWRGPESYQSTQDACLRNWNELHRLIAEHLENNLPAAELGVKP